MEQSGKSLVTELAGIHEIPNEGKLRIKLKSPKIEEQTPIETISDDQLSVCEFCNRGFSSGKALGGHMRIHVQENRGDITRISKNPKITRKSIEKSQHLDSLSKNPICSLCSKGFLSIKSLCGHMRCHPEREYRGIKPPQTGHHQLSSSSTVSDERESTNPIFFSWLAKDKRGRMSLIPSPTSSTSDEYGLSEEEKEVVHDLMMLAQGESFHLDLPSKHKFEAKNSNQMNIRAEFGYKDPIFESKKHKIEDVRYGSECKKMVFNETVPSEAEIGHKDPVFELKRRRYEDLGHGSNCKKLKINETVTLEAKDKDKNLFGSSKDLSSCDEFGGRNMDGDESSDDLIIANMSSEKKRILKKKPKLVDFESKENEGEYDQMDNNKVVKYKCSTSNKCFPSHQALGGHRSSHNKFKNTNQTLDSDLVSPHKLDVSPPIIRCGDTKEANMNPSVLHQCRICNKIFPTGQALGGHQRCHWAGLTRGSASSHDVGPSSHATSSSGVRGFDLNEVPLMEEEDSGVESYDDAQLVLYGYAS